MRRIEKESLGEVSLLHERFVYLNTLRVGVGQFYLLVVGGVFLSSAFTESIDVLTLCRYCGLPMLLVGLSVFAFDIKARARAAAVARGIWARTTDDDGVNGEQSVDRWSEDFFFSVIIASVNAFIVVAVMASFRFDNLNSIASSALFLKLIAPVVFALGAVAQMFVWSHFERSLRVGIDEWPR